MTRYRFRDSDLQKITTRSGFFLKQDPSKYDASFFSMTPAEAAGTDPQQRMLLEVTYEALENGAFAKKLLVVLCH
jgi:acyl transferase domain-containing protein